jgi:hypothetical protein
MSEPAASGPGKPILASATRSESTTVTGLTYSLRVKVEAKMSSFQASTKTNAPVAKRAGAASGMMIEVSTRNRPAPSTFAASSTSVGNSRKKVANSQMANGKKKIVSGIIAPSWVPMRPLSLSCTRSATSKATGGKNAIASIMLSNPLE